MQRYSHQRERIYETVCGTKEHPTAQMVYDALRSEMPKLSLGTVYRNLSLLESLGEVIKISSGDSCDRYDGNVGEHYHFACEDCGCVDDVPIPVDFAIDDIAHKALGAKVKRHSTIFFGTCKKCLKKS